MKVWRSVCDVLIAMLPAVCDSITMIQYHCCVRKIPASSRIIQFLAVIPFICCDVAEGFGPDGPSVASVQPDSQKTIETPQLISSEVTELIRGLILMTLPETFEDNDDWGKEIRIQSGLNVELSGGKIHTSRRHKLVNHGQWVRASASLADPQKTFELQILRLPGAEKGPGSYEVTLRGIIHATAQQQQWNTGVMLWSISGDADVEVIASVTVDVTQDIVQTENGWVIRILPVVRQSSVFMKEFRLRRVSHANGSVVRELGEWIEPLVRRQVKKLNRELTEKLNRSLEKKPDRFEIPVWYASKS